MIKKRKASAFKSLKCFDKRFNSLEIKLIVSFNNVQDNQVLSKNVDIQQDVSQVQEISDNDDDNAMVSEVANIRQDDQLKSLSLPTKPFAKENYNPDDDLEYDSILSLITNKKIKNDNNDLERILRLLLSKGRIGDQNEDTIDQINQLLSNIQDEQRINQSLNIQNKQRTNQSLNIQD
ncbi:16992_t:CDS:2 [Funneliformis caledonium]|uniref:16992_t:CDS:1 n=1 Tax=Funneliformis caledonium TaxID=1117310 RepID=A0A9N9F7X4_9GLOM|nr:16992_t:CDS:2 [Funneliformis caledonium]